MADQCGHRIMAITSAFQADDAGSIPADRSKKWLSSLRRWDYPEWLESPSEWRILFFDTLVDPFIEFVNVPL